MIHGFELYTKPSFFDETGPLEDSGFWRPFGSTLRKFSDVKHIEGILFKKSKRVNFSWKSRYYVLFDDRLAYFKVIELISS